MEYRLACHGRLSTIQRKALNQPAGDGRGLRCHGGDSTQVQGTPLAPFDTTNPDHVFEVHPLLNVGGDDVSDSLEPIDGFRYKDAERAFSSYENLRSHITPGSTTTTIDTNMGGYNYVEFMAVLNEDPTHRLADGGLSAFASIEDLEGDLLVRKRRLVFAPGTEPLRHVLTLQEGDRIHVVGVPRISLALLSWRTEHRNDHPEALDWSLPYEMVVVADFKDAANPMAGEGEGATTLTPEEATTRLTRLLSDQTSNQIQKAACTFTAGTKTFCADLTAAQCTQLSGTWSATTTCGGGD